MESISVFEIIKVELVFFFFFSHHGTLERCIEMFLEEIKRTNTLQNVKEFLWNFWLFGKNWSWSRYRHCGNAGIIWRKF